MQKIIDQKKSSAVERCVQLTGTTLFDLTKRRLQQQNSDTVIVPVESEVDFDLLVPKHKTAQYLLKEIDGFYALHTTSLNAREVVYLFGKEVKYLAREIVKSWSCSTRMMVP